MDLFRASLAGWLAAATRVDGRNKSGHDAGNTVAGVSRDRRYIALVSAAMASALPPGM